MIYSKLLQRRIPISVEALPLRLADVGVYTRYTVKDGKIPVGVVKVLDIDKGVHVEYIENMNPNLYSGFGKVADQIEVEHCMKRGMSTFQILSEAALNSHALHYLRGKRFFSKEAEEKVKEVIANTPVGQRFDTKSLGKIRMFMPQELIDIYKEIIKKCPIILK